MPIARNFVVNKGHTFEEVIVVQRNNKVVDLTNYSVRCTAAEGYIHDYFKVKLGTKILDAENGVIKISMSPEDSKTVKVPKMVYTLSIKNNNTGVIEDVLEGRLIMNQTRTWDAEW